MNEKEIAELRRRLKPEKNAITHIVGCFVNDHGEIVSQFDQPLALMPQQETEELLSILRRTLSGALNKNLLNISFETQQVVKSEEHELLMRLRDSSLQDAEAVQTFFSRVTTSLHLETAYMILLAQDTYDVPYRGKDDLPLEDASDIVYTYLLCSICPVKTTKPALSYYIAENKFYNRTIDWVLSPPAIGFLFPAFTDRCADLYHALYYTKNTSENYDDLVDALFHRPLPMPADTQKETFDTLLQESLGEDCSFELVQAIHETVSAQVEAHKEAKIPEPLVLQKEDVRELLTECGATEKHVEAFCEKYEEAFGEETGLCAQNVIDTKQFQLATPNVSIKVNPARSDLIQTRILDGARYLLVRIEEGVEVNGIPVQITKDPASEEEAPF